MLSVYWVNFSMKRGHFLWRKNGSKETLTTGLTSICTIVGAENCDPKPWSAMSSHCGFLNAGAWKKPISQSRNKSWKPPSAIIFAVCRNAENIPFTLQRIAPLPIILQDGGTSPKLSVQPSSTITFGIWRPSSVAQSLIENPVWHHNGCFVRYERSPAAGTAWCGAAPWRHYHFLCCGTGCILTEYPDRTWGSLTISSLPSTRNLTASALA